MGRGKDSIYIADLRRVYSFGRSEKPFLGLPNFARPDFGGLSRRCSVMV